MCNQQRPRPACAYAQSDQSLCLSLEYSMTLKLLTKHYFEFLTLPGDSMGSSGSTLVKMPHCWKSHVTAHLMILDGQTGRKTLQQCKTISLPLDALIKVINKLTIRVKLGIFGLTAKFGHPPCLFHSSVIGIKNKLTKETVKILMRRLLRSCLVWISTICKCVSEFT